jgi:hypothetical protein
VYNSILPEALSLFMPIERDVGLMMIDEGKALRIPDQFIPRSEQKDEHGRTVLMAIVIDAMMLVEFEQRVRALRLKSRVSNRERNRIESPRRP